jgi:NADH:ubiquinone oxidoreductase subunit F (NADH-binding)/Pyruvate/2-oxoacid:ferredoxin oxidoreductase delta subunit/(2Fe-2S) ferredoxin
MAAENSQTTRSFLIDKVLKNFSGLPDKEVSENLAAMRKHKVSRPAIFIGTGTCGIMAGAEETRESVYNYLLDKKIQADVVEVGCIGLCSEEPILDIQLPGKTRLSFRKVTPERVEAILEATFGKSPAPEDVIGQYRTPGAEPWAHLPHLDELPWFSYQVRHVLARCGVTSPHSIEDYIAEGGFKSFYKTVLNYTSDKVCEIVQESELQGRGGGGFPTGKKWQIALTTGSDQKYLICNADESDPGSFMDRAVIEGDPFLLIEGIAIAAYAIGANNAFIYLRADYERPIRILENALQQSKEYGFLGENVFGSGFNLTIGIRISAGAFVCGEETALIESLQGRRGLPWSKPPFPAEHGLFGKPTVVNNVKTLANVPAIILNGPAWFRSTGSRSCPGTKVFSLGGKTVSRGLIEVPMGIRLSDIIYKLAGGIIDGKPLKAVHIGGPSGFCIPPEKLDTEVGFESLHEIGAAMGAGGLIVLDDSVCMVDLSKYFMKFLQNESCGKCIPCREGTKRMLEILEGITKRPVEESSHETLERFKGVVQLENLAEVIRDTSLCGLGQNASNPVLSTLRYFRDEYEEHIFDRSCRAMVCRDLRSFVIEVEKCTGCNICQKKCPENAIIGVLLSPHFIVEEKCTGCAICFDVCKFSAIYYK